MKLPLLALALALAGCPKSSTPPPEPPHPDVPVEEPPVAARSYEMEDNHLVLPGPIVFEETILDAAASDDALQHILAWLQDKPDITTVRIEGHTDGSNGGGDLDLDFSGERALGVGYWLVEHGIDCKRIIIAAYGDTKPVAAEGSPENVRIEVVAAALRGKLIGGMPANGSAPASTLDSCP